MACSPLRLAALLSLAAAFPAAAQAAAPPERQSTLVIYGNDPCPSSGADNEVVVCARRPEEERYRIPRRIRERQPTETSWASRVEGLEEEGRVGRPNSCSVVGSYGFTGCNAAMIRQWYAERRARRAAERSIP
ncbi:MAG TPA: hypothetical protein VEC11_05655 [Allosphingosinicella sp.]|nr:hypothetical protein [Allosphingosinicella sp.]